MPTDRVRSLDGLRGVAALAVVLNHCLLASPVLAEVADGRGRAAAGSLEWWLSYTPLHLLWGGTEAVFVFFVLSGYVLTGPAMKASFRWRSYYPKRLVRLYVPVWGSLLLAAATAIVVPRAAPAAASWWVQAHHELDPLSALVSGTLLVRIDFLNNPLWSLMWEVWFSLLLPLYVLVARWSASSLWRTGLVLGLLGVCMVSGSVVGSNALRYLPMFAVGVLLHVHRERVLAVASRVLAVRGGATTSVVLVVLLLSSYWTAQASELIPAGVASASRALQVVGAGLLVVLATAWPTARRGLETKPVLWLGHRSFSLYLTHDAVVITTVLLLGGTAPWWIVVLIVVPISLVLAEVFHRLVERPSHLLAQRIGRAVDPQPEERAAATARVS